MAELLDQSAIDELLGSSMDLDDADDVVEEDVHAERPAKTKRIIKPVIIRKTRFEYQYRSPIVKSADCLFNPVEEIDNSNMKPVVWSIRNYNSRRKKRQESA